MGGADGPVDAVPGGLRVMGALLVLGFVVDEDVDDDDFLLRDFRPVVGGDELRPDAQLSALNMF